ncbi:class I SAM-dependent methyltransferase [Acaryochloris sp. IP29b_bin.148]|uniref:class I SAM-dependent methyltransferase n=1 Tax=Acaryochloris sp. IP29b_bin.148 TaxID=2969218 RepID=UPI0026362A5A|nr:class I SAM-dependent methyltransferase [Acaryochloris sp. IP29b_bin.148]
MTSDSVSAYENHARKFLTVRDRSTIGIPVIEQWAHSLPASSDVLEIACGGGIPVTRTLAVAGLKLWAVDSSPTLISEFKLRFPEIPVECAHALESDYFGQNFNAVISIGLLFLLCENDQVRLIHRVSQLLLPGGRFLFTAPIEIGIWTDTNTGHKCRSLGRERYESILQEAQLHVLSTYVDEGQNNYYDVMRD